ncbi:Calmodulin-like protein 12 (Touch-induced calmodulin-related protein 3), partial [Durusdinium trenchii]
MSGDGVISIKELYQMFKAIGKKVSRTHLQSLLAEIDTDGNGTIDFEELCILEIKMSGARPRADLIDYREYLTERQVAKLESIFLRYDQKNTGLIGLESFCSIVESLAPWTEKTPVEKRATRTDYEEVVAEAADSERESSGSARYLQQEEVVEYRRIFKHTTERKGQSGLTKSDLDKILRRMGATLTKVQLKEFFEYFDTDGSGLMDLVEFCIMIVRVRGLKKFREISPETCDARELWKQEQFTIEAARR